MIEYGLKFTRKVFKKIRRRKIVRPAPQYTGQDASDLIYNLLSLDEPCMIARFGNVELECVADYLRLNPKNTGNYLRYIIGDDILWDWSENTKKYMRNNAGFFPIDNENLSKFAEFMLRIIPKVDILASWLSDERFVKKILNAKTISLGDIEPYGKVYPWSRILENKTVLVIHPFTETIKKQYLQREHLFADKNVLPEFNLVTIKAIQSIAGNECGYKTWFDALDHMKNKISEKEFDIAIIGCGAYGFPLAAFVKDQGKKAVHMGGATQILFGIKGARWDALEDYPLIYNEYWVRPSEEETPKNNDIVEGGCYW